MENLFGLNFEKRAALRGFLVALREKVTVMSRRTAAGLSRERVLIAGLDLVDREGVDALTMRRLGRELGVEAMSLYSYVTSKQDLLNGVLDRVYGQVPLGLGSHGPWQERLRDTARLFRHVLLRHPHTVCLLAGRPVLTEQNMRVVRPALAELRACGLDMVLATRVITVLITYTIGHVASEVGDPGRSKKNGPGFEASFDLGLDFIVSGVECLVEPLVTS